MKFKLSSVGELSEVKEAANESGGLIDKWNEFSDWVIGKEVEFILRPIGEVLKYIAIHTWHWFIVNLPDIMGYTTIAAGAFIILTSMIGKGGMLKTLGWYFAAFILSVCILGSV
jgi:hypothetical protein